MPDTRCSNPRHPYGPWHLATPLPLTGALHIERFKQWRNRRRWGCRCDAFATAEQSDHV